jgi:hypothetical protein
MDEKYKVENRNNFAVGITLQNPYREQNIMPMSFAKLSKDEIAYVDSISTLFKRGMLFVDDEEINEMLGYNEVNKNIISEDEIKTLLKGNISNMKKRFNQLDEIHAKNKVIKVLKEIGADLTMKKVKWLKDFFGKEIFIDEIG